MIAAAPKALKAKSRKAALLAADWFVETQMNNDGQPFPNANCGRFMYNCHRHSDYQTWGVDWSSARALFVLNTAYRITKEAKYLDCIKKGLEYIYSLQILDVRNKKNYGVFHEETPHSFWVYPRDGMEVADALLDYYKITKDKEALFRAEAYIGWFLKEAMFKRKDGFWWAAVKAEFDGTRDHSMHSCEGGNMMGLIHAYEITGKAKYKTAAKRIADSMIGLYHKKPGLFIDLVKPKVADHHTKTSGEIENDDGAGVGFLNLYKVTGQQKYLDHALSLGDYHHQQKGEYKMYCSLPAVGTFMLELAKISKNEKYFKTAEIIVKKTLKIQHLEKKNKMCHGAFIGEDEGGINYVPGFKKAKPEDMVTTRTTAFAALTFFKYSGEVWPLGYSVL